MDQYLKQKIVPKVKVEDKPFAQKLKELITSKPEMVEDFQKPMVKDLGVEKIDTRGAAQPLTSGADFAARQAARNGAINQVAASADDGLDYNQLRKQYQDMAKASRGAMGARKLLGAVPALGALTQVVPSALDLKEGNPNTAMARMVTGLAPAGTGELDAKLMQQAQLQDHSPELQDPTYLNTLKAIGERRQSMGKSPVVESISGQQVDTSAKEDNDFLNKVLASQRAKSNG